MYLLYLTQKLFVVHGEYVGEKWLKKWAKLVFHLTRFICLRGEFLSFSERLKMVKNIRKNVRDSILVSFGISFHVLLIVLKFLERFDLSCYSINRRQDLSVLSNFWMKQGYPIPCMGINLHVVLCAWKQDHLRPVPQGLSFWYSPICKKPHWKFSVI